MTYFDVEQGTEKWQALRLGLPTASEFKSIMAKVKTGEAAARRNYRAALVIEQFTGTREDIYHNEYMDWGHDTEELAALKYSLLTGNQTEECGIFIHEKLEAGASPDRLVGDKGLVEIKCKKVANHILTLKLGHMPPEHKAQVQGQLLITGREWCDFVSFDPRMPKNAQLFVERIYRDEDYILLLTAEILTFNVQLKDEVAFIRGYKT